MLKLLPRLLFSRFEVYFTVSSNRKPLLPSGEPIGKGKGAYSRAPRRQPVALEIGVLPLWAPPSCGASPGPMSACTVAGGGAAAALGAACGSTRPGHGGAHRPPASALNARGLEPGAEQRLPGGTAAGQRGREAHGGPQQPPGQGDGRGGPGAPGRRLHVPRSLLPPGPGARARGPAGAPRRAGECGRAAGVGARRPGRLGGHVSVSLLEPGRRPRGPPSDRGPRLPRRDPFWAGGQYPRWPRAEDPPLPALPEENSGVAASAKGLAGRRGAPNFDFPRLDAGAQPEDEEMSPNEYLHSRNSVSGP